MMTAFRATYSDFKLVRTRKVVQIVLEVPLEQSNAVLEVLGGMPDPSKESWVGVARLRSDASQPQPVEDKPPAGAKRDWHARKPQSQAAIRIQEPAFSAFLRENHPDEWHETGDAEACIKFMLRIERKRELETNHTARMAWNTLDQEYLAWKALEHA